MPARRTGAVHVTVAGGAAMGTRCPARSFALASAMRLNSVYDEYE